MRVDLVTVEEISVAVGEPGTVVFDVINDASVIDGITASIDVPHGMTATAPGMLPLFPDGHGQIEVEIGVSSTFAAGTYDLVLVLHSAAVPGGGAAHPFRVVVPPAPAASLDVLPNTRAARREARYLVVADNRGNVPLDLALGASDPERKLSFRFRPSTLSVAPGSSEQTQLRARRRRRLIGGDIAHQITVVASSPDAEVATDATFRHRSIIPPGFRTLAILAAIVVAWAVIVVVALNHALGNDPFAKQVPASFYASLPPSAIKAATLSSLGGIDYNLASSDGASAPPGAVPKTGIVVGVGGTLAGSVTAASTGSGIGQITVEAWQDGYGRPSLTASAATQSDGSYSIVGLLPGPYFVEFLAAGYAPVWYPDAPSQTGARPVQVAALNTTGGIDATIAGKPGTITGAIVTGETPAPPVTISVEALQGSSTKSIRTVVSQPNGHYTIPALPTPGTYDLIFTATGYNTATDQEQLAGGATDIANTVDLSAGPGSISGTVTSGGQPLGGVTITAVANGITYRTATPTAGQVGTFDLTDLPSPSTYLLTFSKAGYGSDTLGEPLGPGKQLTGIAISLAGGAGTVSGQVRTSTGTPLGGVTVTVGDGVYTTTTRTLTTGTEGAFDVSGLHTPQQYTLTFSLPGYASQTISVSLSSSGSASGIDVTLPAAAASILGTVVDATTGRSLNGVTVSLTDGATTLTTTSSSQPPGTFQFADLAPGSYTLTFTLPGYGEQTYVVAVGEGGTSSVTAVLTAVGT